MRRSRITRTHLTGLLGAALALPLAVMRAQHPHAGHAAGDSTSRGGVMAMAIPLVTRATPTAGGRSLTEGYLTQPMLMAAGRRRDGTIAAVATLDFEGLTLRRGELTTGTWGEGFVDRRHPHTYLHEAMVSVAARRRVAHLSLSAGRGFVPLGSDDPMLRPFVKYPANHHLAQLLERWVAIGAARRGALAIEVALFNGDEPLGPGIPSRLDRLGDSWGARLLWMPGPWELAASTARVESPEDPGGAGLDQQKVALSARWVTGEAGRRRYAFLEWARTDDWRPAERAFRHATVLGETLYCTRRASVALRFEQTERPEEEREFDLFRVPRPHGDFNLVGRTRLRTATLAIGGPAPTRGALRAVPFAELALTDAAAIGGGVLRPETFYGSRRLGMLSVGVRLHAGRWHRRMGHYGVAADGVHLSTTC